jgi:O-antigen ligase
MSPEMALLACFVFILVLFGLDTGLKSKVSPALWIPTAWMLIISSRMISQWLNINHALISEQAYVEGSELDRNIFLVLIVMALGTVAARGVSFSQVVKANGWIFIYLVYCGISISWSDYPEVSFKRYIKDIGNLLMVLVVLSERAPVEAIVTLVKRCTYVLIPLSVVMMKYYSEFGRSYSRWDGQLSITGMTNNKNSLGVLCAVCGIGIVWNLASMWRNNKISANKLQVLVQGLMLIMTMWVLLLAHSATAIVCFIIGAGIVIVMAVDALRSRSIILFGLPVFLLLGVYMFSSNPVAFLTGLVGRNETLTDRTEIWQKVIEMAGDPIVGVGYRSFWLGDRLERLWSDYSWHPTEAHNGYLEIYLDLGVIGVILLTGILISSLRANITLVRSDLELGPLKLAMLVSIIIYNIAESAFRPDFLMYFVFTLVVIQFPRPVQKLISDTSASHLDPGRPQVPREKNLPRYDGGYPRSVKAPASVRPSVD